MAVVFHGAAEAKSRQSAPLQASIIVDADTGAVLQASNADSITHPASLTKMMTLHMLFDQMAAGRMRLNQRLEVSSHAAAQSPSKLGLQPGQTIAVEDAIRALVTKSANDVAVVVAEAIGGSEDRFAALMTRRARELGMSRTTFRNASGLPDADQITTARDMATLGRALLHGHKRYYHYFSTRSFDWNGDTISTHNRLMLRYNGADGIKTGYIRASGFNLVSSAERGGRRLVGVVMGGRSAASRDRRMESLLDAAFTGINAPDEIEEAAAPPAKPAVKPAAKPAPVKVAQEEKPVPPAKPQPATDAKGRKIAVLKLPDAAAKGRGKAQDEKFLGDGDAEMANWGIQLGAYAAESAARNAAEIAARRHADLRESRIVVSRSKAGKKVLYRARVLGMTEAQARGVCRKITDAKGCLVLQPGA